MAPSSYKADIRRCPGPAPGGAELAQPETEVGEARPGQASGSGFGWRYRLTTWWLPHSEHGGNAGG
jgi:hypothetical protein